MPQPRLPTRVIAVPTACTSTIVTTITAIQGRRSHRVVLLTGGSNSAGRTTAEIFSSGRDSGWRCYGYDARREQTQNSLSVTADSQTTTQTVAMVYNDGGEIASLTYPDGDVVTASYNSDGYFQGTSDANGAIMSGVQYTPAGLFSSLTLGGLTYKGSATTPLKINLGYDNIQRPLSVSAVVSGNTLLNQQRTYDNVGNVENLYTTLPTTGGGSKTDNQSFCYDALNRLVWGWQHGNSRRRRSLWRNAERHDNPSLSTVFQLQFAGSAHKWTIGYRDLWGCFARSRGYGSKHSCRSVCCL